MQFVTGYTNDLHYVDTDVECLVKVVSVPSVILNTGCFSNFIFRMRDP